MPTIYKLTLQLTNICIIRLCTSTENWLWWPIYMFNLYLGNLVVYCVLKIAFEYFFKNSYNHCTWQTEDLGIDSVLVT